MDHAGRNRLDEEESPYLSQHADNPVHWQPWDERALAEARERDVPIFLSVGYSACHWCHVMEEESFADESVAEFLNEHFVPIKVDREERPDIDSIYMTICQRTTGRGGWPLSVWLTPDGRPFFVGTYFPPTARQGMPGFRDVLERLAESWEQDRDEIENRADQWGALLRNELEETPDTGGEVSSEALSNATSAALRSADREYGGFGSSGPKFPQPSRLELLLRSHVRTGREEPLQVATRTLDAMADGGMYDHLGGGFHRYATDRKWVVPHFEKMLYDNALLPRIYLGAYQLTGTERYAQVARETFAFLDRELSHPEGGFYSTLDARSEGEEGTFYVWTPEGVADVLDDEELVDLVCDRYGITPGGNFEGGSTVLTLAASLSDLADEYDRSVEDVRARLDGARERLFEARTERVRPARDEKVLASWNGMTVSALALGGRVLDDSYAERAEKALSFVRERLWDAEERRLAHRYKDGDVKGPGFLEDYAFLARGAFDLYQVSGDVDHLAFALDLARAVKEEFWDPEGKTLYFTPASGEGLVTRPQELSDQSTPSSLGVTVDLLFALDGFAPDADFSEVARQVLETHANRIQGNPMEHVTLALAADTYHQGVLELTLAADELPEAWRETLATRYLPAAVVTRRPATDAALGTWLERLDIDEAPPVWAGREARDGPTVYACEGFTCSPPKSSVEEALSWFEGDGESGADGA
ncbi:thioredoxin domain-containing protein [Salinigranum rubrum]|uniref:Thioredoxin domain-containing protein n=1 Tax=Salinigranum rubrum TaxID=755307 RepID=A0A2I8VJB0_9EURY|nr:thioredoxin domain-containing protein [Salinigranum rubrum]AUV81984.1 thioredoxin domain-containing protein [Salinigranum rubrum]